MKGMCGLMTKVVTSPSAVAILTPFFDATDLMLSSTRLFMSTLSAWKLSTVLSFFSERYSSSVFEPTISPE
ncbi:MAG: hypothetical protein IPM79_25165 [Polyangiaceae bacterium]|nr:hypothetical protein [Polyangiaceae bacterium]